MTGLSDTREKNYIFVTLRTSRRNINVISKVVHDVLSLSFWTTIKVQGVPVKFVRPHADHYTNYI